MRITGGQARGIPLKTPKQGEIRPATDYLRQAVFSSLADIVPGTRVLDLFRSWDADGDGAVSRAEFHRAMPALGLDVDKHVIDQLFSDWDTDGGGELGYAELRKILKPPPVVRSTSPRPGPSGKTSPTSAPPAKQAAGKMKALGSATKALTKMKLPNK